MKKTYVMAVMIGVSLLAGCSASTAPQPVVESTVSSPAERGMVIMGQDGRADVKRTVDSLIAYCDEWASAYEMRLGKVYAEGYNECIDLTARMMKGRSKEVIQAKSGKEFPFVE